MLINLVPRVPYFYIRTKFRLKKSCNYGASITMLNKFFHSPMLFKQEIYCKLKNIHLKKPPLISKKSFFDLFTLVYIRLDSSSDSSILVYICLDSSSDSSTLIYIRLEFSSDSLHSSTFAYIRLYSSTLV